MRFGARTHYWGGKQTLKKYCTSITTISSHQATLVSLLAELKQSEHLGVSLVRHRKALNQHWDTAT